MVENSSSKATLRRMLLADRQAIRAEVRQQFDAAIAQRVFAWWNANPAQVLGVYWPIRSEPDLRTAYTELASSGAQLALPIVAVKDAPLQFAAWTPGEPLVKDGMGVMVPATIRVLHPDALLIPCVGFNDARVRLGYGGGFYDRTLAVAPRPLAVGIAYSVGRCEFESAAHDIALDDIITEQSPLEFAPLSL
jgi:5-formyltetrahydrofolate cyclo-ligase